MHEGTQSTDLYVTDLEGALKRSGGSQLKTEVLEQLSAMSVWLEELSQKPQTEGDYERMQTVLDGVAAARELMHLFPASK